MELRRFPRGGSQPASTDTRVNVISSAALVLATCAVARAQIVTENAGVLSPQTPTLHEAFACTRSEHGTELVATQELLVGLDRSNELRLTLPAVWRRFTTPAGDADVAGLADASLRWKHALWRDDDVMESRRWSVLAALTAPTGERTTSADGLAIPPDLRTSRDDWTFALGQAFTTIADRHRFSVETTFRHRTAHDGFRLGDSFDLNLAYWYRLTPAAFEDLARTTEVRGVVELLASHRWDSQVGGAAADDGGTLVWFAPGLQVFPADWCLLEVDVALPVAQTTDDAWGERRFAALFSVKFLF